jgi:DNA-binding NarL/FixJ family response regulator
MEDDSPRGARVIIADDDVLMREGLASLFERSGFDVVGTAADGTELVALARRHRPDLAIVDIRMPPSHNTEGLVAARAIRLESPSTSILVLSAHVEVDHAKELLAGGTSVGYLLKSRITDVGDLLSAIERIMKGQCVVDPVVVAELLASRSRGDVLGALSARELEVLKEMAEGRSNSGIARALGLAEATVEKHVGNILTKLNLTETLDDHRRVRAVIMFLESLTNFADPGR